MNKRRLIKMAFYKQKKQGNNTFKKEDQLVWKNTTHEANFNPMKNWYGIIDIGNKSYTVEYQSKFRSEVAAIFEEEARLSKGKLTYIGVYK
jgi:hypothetical protein